MAFDRSKFIPRFIEDANDHLRAMNQGLVALVETPSDLSLVGAVFRAAHTIKGSSRMMKLIHISDMAHVLEDVLDGLRKEKIAYSGAISTVLFEGMDTLSKMMEYLSQGEEKEAPKRVITLLKQAAQGELEDQGVGKEQKNNGQEKDLINSDQPRVIEKIKIENKTNISVILPPPPCPEPETYSVSDDCSEPEVVAVTNCAGASQPFLEKIETSDKAVGKIEETIRVDVDKLDALINLMGEVVSTHKKIETHARQIHGLFMEVDDFQALVEQKKQDYKLEHAHGHSFDLFFDSLYDRIKLLNQGIHDYLGQFQPLMTQMQERSLDLRMVPLSTVFDTLHMVVRDLCRDSEKTVSLEITGGDTEMDKKMTEHLKDPLLHMIRNCIDHGMEAQEVRLKDGKPSHGTIRIAACIDGGRVYIILADDGGGIPVDKVAQKALARGLVTESVLKDMDPSQVAQLIFHPGLSTADIITDISGRGVGMDVVRQNIENALNGTISVDTIPGQGTTFHIRLPETIAIIHVFLVNLNSLCYAIPASHVAEIVSIPGNEIFNVQDKAVLRLRGELVPVVPMADVLGHPPLPDATDIQDETSLLILVSGQGEDRLGMIIDSLISEEEQVVKPLPLHMRGMALVTGAILSDTHGIILVLHMLHMVEQAKKIQKTNAPSFQEAHAHEISQPRILVVDDSITTREIEKLILESHGYEVTLATDGVDGLKKASEFAYDLIVSDVDMPGLDGFAMTAKLRSTAMHAHTPIIIVTVRDSQADMRKGITSGANAYIVKGDLDKNNLLETIENLLGISKRIVKD
jgi:chemotaxis protein histidine kinase CheA/ActR/RegA family two-component response regulator